MLKKVKTLLRFKNKREELQQENTMLRKELDRKEEILRKKQSTINYLRRKTKS